jgi:ribonucleoside-diphosphate reductase alpha chain
MSLEKKSDKTDKTERSERNSTSTMSESMYVVKRNGEQEEVSFDKIIKRIQKYSKDLTKSNAIELAQQIIAQIFNGIPTHKIDELTAEICAAKTTVHPDYGKLASRIIISNHHKNTSPSYSEVIQQLWDNKDVLGENKPLINERLYKMVIANKEKINATLDYEYDFTYDYFGFKTLERAYLMRINDKIVERPQHLLMRVALSIHKDDLKEALKSYKMMAEGYFTHATPTLFNMGTQREQASSCFLLTVDEDSVEGIYKTLTDCAKISKHAGGIGIAFHKIRAKNSRIRGTNGIGNGLIPMLKVFNETARFINQSGKRAGSIANYLEPWHADIEDFLKLRLNTGIEEERARDLFYAVWISDLFMRRVEADEDWSLMCPDKCPNLYLKYGPEFEELYIKYEKEGRANKTVKARTIWEAIITAQIETGMPYIGYKDAINTKNNQKNLGTIQSSNLCIEICEYTSRDEIAVCNLASIVLPKFVEKVDDVMTFNYEKLREVTKHIVRNINKVIDYCYYPVKEAEYSNRKNRPQGIGISGLANIFAMMKLAFDSDEARVINRKIFENMYFASLEASMEIARKRKKYVQEYKRLIKLGSGGANHTQTNNTSTELSEDDRKRMVELKETYFIFDDELKLPNQYAGAYSSFIGSPLYEGKFQFDLWGVEPSVDMKEEWEALRADIQKHGVRNSLLIALMPTASTSQIMGSNECIEPFTNNIYTRKTLAGTFVVVNKYLINDLLELGIWNPSMKDKIILADGSIQDIPEIPNDIKERYKTVWEIKQKVLIDLSADRAAFVCQTQSLNLFVKNPTYKTLNAMHFYSWKKGLKTGIYYLRSQAKTSAQKFSVDLENVKTKEESGLNGLTGLNAIMNINSNEKGNSGNSNNNPNTKSNEEPPECLMCSS